MLFELFDADFQAVDFFIEYSIKFVFHGSKAIVDFEHFILNANQPAFHRFKFGFTCSIIKAAFNH